MRESVARNDPDLIGGSPVGRARYLLLTLFVVAGVGVTLYAALSSMNIAQQRAQDAFDEEFALHVLVAEQRIHGSLEAVEEVGDLFDSSSFVSDEEFQTFVSRALGRHPDLLALAWAPMITEAERDAFETHAREDGTTGYEILEYGTDGTLDPAGLRDTYYPIQYAVTVDGFTAGPLPVGGLDVSTVPWTRGATGLARDTGTLTATPAFAAASGTQVAIIQPVYLPGFPTDTVVDRRASISGFIVGVVQPSDLLSHANSTLLSQRAQDRVAVMVTDSGAIGGGGILFNEPGFDDKDPEFIRSTDLQAANQTWVFIVASRTTFYATRDRLQPWLWLILGLLITGLISGYLIILQRRSNTAEAMVATRARQLAVANAALSREINERTAAEAQAVAERGQLQSILNTTVDAIITINGEGLIQSFNSAAQSMFGYAPSEVINKNVSLLMPEPDHSEHDQYLNNYQMTGKAKIIGIGREVTGLRKGGGTFPLELSVSEAPVKEGTLYTGIVRDISVRKAAEARLAESEARLRAMLESAPIGMAWSTPGEPMRTANPKLREILGRTAEEIAGHRISDFAAPGTQRRESSTQILADGRSEVVTEERRLLRGGRDGNLGGSDGLGSAPARRDVERRVAHG